MRTLWRSVRPRDYLVAWYDADSGLMEQVLHPDLAKRTVSSDPTGRTRFNHMGAMAMVKATRGRAKPVGYIVGGYRYPDTVGPGGKFVIALRRDGKGLWRIAADIENGSQSR